MTPAPCGTLPPPHLAIDIPERVPPPILRPGFFRDVPCLCVSLTLGIPCVDVQCPDPPQCVAGKYSPDGLDGGGNKACSSCPAGKDKAYIHVYTYIYWCLYLHRR